MQVYDSAWGLSEERPGLCIVCKGYADAWIGV